MTRISRPVFDGEIHEAMRDMHGVNGGVMDFRDEEAYYEDLQAEFGSADRTPTTAPDKDWLSDGDDERGASSLDGLYGVPDAHVADHLYSTVVALDECLGCEAGGFGADEISSLNPGFFQSMPNGAVKPGTGGYDSLGDAGFSIVNVQALEARDRNNER